MSLYLKVEINQDSFQEIELSSPRITMGRDETNWIAVDKSFISSRHAVITQDDEGDFYIEDRDSSNGTFLNDIRVKLGKRYFKEGDKIKLGSLVFEVFKKDNSIPVVPLRERRKEAGRKITTP